MKPKWYLGAFIVIVTLLGAGLQQFSVPNQEIVLQFEDEEISLFETEQAIANVKKQLQDIGVEKIKVYKGSNGILKITYFSDVAVSSIKKIFSQEKALKLNYPSIAIEEGTSKTPSDNKPNTYQLDVFEIQKSNGNEGDLNGLVIELLPENDRSFNPDVYYSALVQDVRFKNDVEKVAYKIYSTLSIEIDNATYNIPEVRAGPILI